MMGTFEFEFKKFTGEKLPNVVDYVKEYYNTHRNIYIMVGTDSQGRGAKTVFSTIVAMYNYGDGEHGHGAHCIFRRWTTPRYRANQRAERLLKEVEESLNVAHMLRDAGIPVKCVDIDINPNPGDKQRNKSYEVYLAAKGWVEGEGFECRYKTIAPLITTLADWVVKN